MLKPCSRMKEGKEKRPKGPCRWPKDVFQKLLHNSFVFIGKKLVTCPHLAARDDESTAFNSGLSWTQLNRMFYYPGKGRERIFGKTSLPGFMSDPQPVRTQNMLRQHEVLGRAAFCHFWEIEAKIGSSWCVAMAFTPPPAALTLDLCLFCCMLLL